jgi:hypothetical protein
LHGRGSDADTYADTIADRIANGNANTDANADTYTHPDTIGRFRQQAVR